MIYLIVKQELDRGEKQGGRFGISQKKTTYRHVKKKGEEQR